jgi:integrase/recombinase XerD
VASSREMIDRSDIVLVPAHSPAAKLDRRDHPTPAVLRAAGPAAVFAWDEFFRGKLRNPHTRLAYGRAVNLFLGWLEPTGVPLTQVTPGMVGSYLDQLVLAPPSKKLTLAALRRFFDTLVLRHVLVLNPATVCRVPLTSRPSPSAVIPFCVMRS